MNFAFVEYHRRANDEELLNDIKDVAHRLQCKHLSMKAYKDNGKYSPDAVADRFGSWNNALDKAGLEISSNRQFTNDELFSNLESVWIQKGSQPVRKDMDNKVLSSISSGSYKRRFGTWNNALREFVIYINSDESSNITPLSDNFDGKHTTSRDPNLRLRFRVMQRDHFKCCLCGASPSTNPSVILHIDHIIPWSEGGETIIQNLQTLCNKCNLGKSNLPNV